jgi:hypothetical protein
LWDSWDCLWDSWDNNADFFFFWIRDNRVGRD